MIIQLEHAVSDDDCRRLTAMYDCRADLTNTRDHTGHPVVYWEQLRELPAAVEIVSPLVENCLCTLGELLPAAGPLYPETVILAALGVGGYHSAHADNCRQNEHGDWVANHTPHRDMTAIWYLNDGFDGGEIVFELQPLTIKPSRGLLLAFPSDAAHLHEVLPVRSGTRYTMAAWFTRQRSFALADLCRDRQMGSESIS
jgi:predicted 2-oxoglutarate/Fe(II)-dependent dioxygenase YbiX